MEEEMGREIKRLTTAILNLTGIEQWMITQVIKTSDKHIRNMRQTSPKPR